jgi:uncharacterized protein (TIGR03000 family)
MNAMRFVPPRQMLAALVAITGLVATGHGRQATPAVQAAKAEITVIVPADAELFFDGDATTQTGTGRLFITPPLTPGTTFQYNLVARWKSDGKVVEQKRTVGVTSGGRVRVNFLLPADDKTDLGEDKEVVTSAVTKRPSVAAVNFRKELNLPFATLGTLGSRIGEARRAGDPVALANAASELAVAEKVSGKKASLTSNTVLQESQELAKLQRQNAQLEAVIETSKRLAAEERSVAQLEQMAAKAKEQAKLEAEAVRNGGSVPYTPRTIVINNTSTDTLDVYVNGNFKMTVGPGMLQSCVVEHRWNPTRPASLPTARWSTRRATLPGLPSRAGGDLLPSRLPSPMGEVTLPESLKAFSASGPSRS